MNKYLIRHCTWEDNDGISIHNVNSCFPEGAPNGITITNVTDIHYFITLQNIFKSCEGETDLTYDEIREDPTCNGIFYMLTEAPNCHMAYSKYVFMQLGKEEKE